MKPPHHTAEAFLYWMQNQGGFSLIAQNHLLELYRQGRIEWSEPNEKVSRWVNEEFPAEISTEILGFITVGLIRARFLADQNRVDFTLQQEKAKLLKSFGNFS